jgi:hypothetical protein
VAVYEDWLRTQPGDLRVHWPQEALERYRVRLGVGACLDAWQVLSRADLIDMVDGVRNRLNELAVTLDREAPDAGERPAPELPISHHQFDNIVYSIIFHFQEVVAMNDYSTNVFGTAGNVAGGQNNDVRQAAAFISNPGTDLSMLLDELRGAIEKLPAEKLDAAQGLLEEVEEDAAAPQATRLRIVRKLKAIAAIAAAAGVAGEAAVKATQSILKAIGN